MMNFGNETDEHDALDTHGDDEAARGAAAPAEPMKRKRGRPRKTQSGNPVLDGIIRKAMTPAPSAPSSSANKRRARAPKAKSFGLGAGPARTPKKKASGAKTRSRSTTKKDAAPKTVVKSEAQQARETKLSVLDALEFSFESHTIQEFLSGVLGGRGGWDSKVGRYVEPEGKVYEVTTAEARELGELLGLELQIEARRRQFLSRARRAIQAAEAAEMAESRAG
jgi:hypothetical protein